MSALTTTQILSAVRRKLLEEGTDLVSDETVLMNANLAYDDVRYGTFTNDQIETTTITFTNGVGTLPANFGTLYGVGFRSATDTTPFNEKSIADFDRTPTENGMTVVGGVLKVSPSTTSSLIVRYYPSYDPLSTSQNPEVHPYLHELIIYGAMWRILEDLQDESRSEYYRGKYEEEFLKRTNRLSNYEEDNQGGNEFFSYQRLI